jgi:hypothetical protein
MDGLRLCWYFFTLEYIGRHPQKKILSSEWENMLRHQLPGLMPIRVKLRDQVIQN